MIISWMVATGGFLQGTAVGVAAALAARQVICNQMRRR